ncbi:hypothetical protein KNT64_gp179 [Pseudomonas phage PspYZU05]|uniref:Uncharacterized protein n=1 Tax=Pseudomonas phage PspYZU05 TaxID=1983556 RepID=A0A2U7NF70_9CAUD|nr:hypothetical protein KNT64_gp179 [Pseudomonas phage PspYZU05]ASD52131.1 hypothetical protein PspYZU05_179 [Pseudomonas phage PspYZU05]
MSPDSMKEYREEHEFDDVESQVEVSPRDEQDSLADYYERKLTKQRLKPIAKNRHEIKRLKNLAEKAILTNNFESYRYALCKLREFYRQPFTPEVIKTMWETTRSELRKVVYDSAGKV